MAKHFKHLLLNCISILIIVLGQFSIQAYPVPPGDGLYPFLRNMHIQGELKNYSFQIPWMKKELETALKTISPENLSAQHKRQLSFYKRKYLKEFYPPYTSWNEENTNRTIKLTPEFYALGLVQDSLKSSNSQTTHLFGFSTLSLMAQGQLSPSLSFYSQVFVGQTLTNQDQYYENYNARYGQPYNSPDKANSSDTLFPNNTIDGVIMGIAYTGSWGNLSLSNDWNIWGPGIWQHSSVSSSGYHWVKDPLPNRIDSLYSERTQNPRAGFRTPGESAPLTQLRWQYHLPFASYTKWIGKRVGLWYDTSAYVVGHRMDFSLGRFNLGFHEILLYSHRNFDLNYLPPFVPLFIMEHFAGDRDNVTLGLDINYTFKQGFRLYFDLFFDDLVSPTSLFDNYWGNKYSLNLGAEGQLLSELVPLEYRVEYSRAEPWMFTHHAPVTSPNNQYQHLGSLLGSSIPANSHRLSGELVYNGLSFFQPSFLYRFSQIQYNDAGSHLLDNHTISDSDSKNFLGNNPETRNSFFLGLKLWGPWNSSVFIQTGGDWVSKAPSLGNHKNTEFFPAATCEVRIAY